MAKEIFKFNFVTGGEGIKTIDEPTGFDGADFVLKQRDKGYGRDITFAGGEHEFTFYRMRNHYFDLLVKYKELYGWEAEVKLIIETSEGDGVIGDLDFFGAKTDKLEYFKCKVVQDYKQALIKKRKDVKVDLFASEDVDGNAITPLTPENILILAKPVNQVSSWETSTPYGFTSPSSADFYYDAYFNPSNNLIKSDIDNSLIPFIPLEVFYFTDGNSQEDRNNFFYEYGDNFKIVTAINNLSNVKIDITNIDVLVTRTNAGFSPLFAFGLFIYYGTDLESATIQSVFQEGNTDTTFAYTQDYSFTIDSLNRGDNVWLIFKSNIGFGNVYDFEVNSMDVDISVSAKAYNTIAPSVRLYDAVSQNVKSISGLSTSFPFAQSGGEMYGNRVLSGNMLRNITSRPFYFSFKDIQGWLPEINADYEVVNDSSVFIGKYPDFYTNTESGVFTSVKFDDYEESFNPRFAINQFNYGYKKYQSQKENELENFYDVVNGESEWVIGNVFVENKKEVKIPFVRDSFMFAETQKKALEESDSTATQEDDTIYIVDAIEKTSDSIFTEIDLVYHSYDSNVNKLTLSNDGSFNWVLLGLAVGDAFTINGGNPNAGNYTVYEASSRKLVLTPQFSGTSGNDGERITSFTYLVTTTTAPYKTRGDEGFNITDNINNTENYANLRYSIKRNIVRFWDNYLATANLYAKTTIKNTFYKNNPDAILKYQSEVTTTEGEAFTPIETPILSPELKKITVITDFATYKTLEEKINTERGYIRVVDRTDFIIKLYPKELKYVNSAKRGELTIIGEEKYTTSYLNIVDDQSGLIVVNDEYYMQSIKYVIQNEKFYIFDETEVLLYRPLQWNKITVNGANASSESELIEWLDLLT